MSLISVVTAVFVTVTAQTLKLCLPFKHLMIPCELKDWTIHSLALYPTPMFVSHFPQQPKLYSKSPWHGSALVTATKKEEAKADDNSSQTRTLCGISCYTSATGSCKKTPSLLLVLKSLLFSLSPLSPSLTVEILVLEFPRYHSVPLTACNCC